MWACGVTTNYNVPSWQFNLLKPKTSIKLQENLQSYHNKTLSNIFFGKLSSYQLLTDGDVCDFVPPSALSVSADKVDLALSLSATGDWVPPSIVWLSDLEPSSAVEDCFWISWNSSNSCPTWSSRSSLSCRSLSLSPSAWWVVYLPSCCASDVA